MSASLAARVSGFPARPHGLRISPRLGPELIQTKCEGTRVHGANASSEALLLVEGSNPTVLVKTKQTAFIVDAIIQHFSERLSYLKFRE